MFAKTKLFQSLNTNKLFQLTIKNFTGKTETGWKFTTPIMKMKSCKPIPPPGDNLEIPSKKFFLFKINKIFFLLQKSFFA